MQEAIVHESSSTKRRVFWSFLVKRTEAFQNALKINRVSNRRESAIIDFKSIKHYSGMSEKSGCIVKITVELEE